MTAPPFLEERPGADTWLMLAPEFEGPVRALGLDREDTIREWIERGCGTPYTTGRAQTSITALPGTSETLVLRRVLHGGALAPLWRGRIAGIARPQAELRVTAALRAAGAPVPRPVAAIARRSGALWQASLATVFEADTLDGIAFFASRPAPEELHAAAKAAGNSIRRFHDLGGRHRDLHLGNLLLRRREGEGGAFDVLVIDLDGARMAEHTSIRDRTTEIARLARSLRKRDLLTQLDSSITEAFSSGYCRGDDAMREALRTARL